jgi:parallel beta-helix repeat protein
MINRVPEPASENLENQEDINQSSNNSQSSSTGPVYESVTVYPQQWATGDGTVGDPWANDCIETALTNAPAGGTIFLKAGYYILSDVATITKAVNIIGEGMGKTIIITANANGFGFSSDYVTLKGFTIDGDAQTDGHQYLSCIGISNCDYASLEDIEVKNAGYYGINLYQVNHSLCQNIYANDNYRHGVHAGSDIAGWNMYNTYRDIYAWDNGVSGFDDRGGSGDPALQRNNLYENIQTWGNTQMGMALTAISDGSLINSSAHDNGLYGIYLGGVYNFTIENCSAYSNYDAGIHLYECDNINLSNVIAKNNNVSDTFYTAGVYIDSSSGIKFMSCKFYDDRDTPLQAYGIELAGTNTNISLVNCKLTPNKEGEIYNPAGVVITVIIQKRGSL